MPENDKVPVVATLTLADGRTFTHRYETERQYADGQEFWWTDGNAACDCNRSSFLNDEYHRIEGQDFRFGGDRRYFGINAGPDDRTFYVNGPMLSALVRLPDGVAPLS